MVNSSSPYMERLQTRPPLYKPTVCIGIVVSERLGRCCCLFKGTIIMESTPLKHFTEISQVPRPQRPLSTIGIRIRRADWHRRAWPSSDCPGWVRGTLLRDRHTEESEPLFPPPPGLVLDWIVSFHGSERSPHEIKRTDRLGLFFRNKLERLMSLCLSFLVRKWKQ